MMKAREKMDPFFHLFPLLLHLVRTLLTLPNNDPSINEQQSLGSSPNSLPLSSSSYSYSKVSSTTTPTSSTSSLSSSNDDEETIDTHSSMDLWNEEEEVEEVEKPVRQQKQKRARDVQEEESGIIVSYKSDQSTFMQFDFVADGAKWLSRNKQLFGYRHYYMCSNHKLTQCKAKYTITDWPTGKTETYESHPHNHPPPSNPYLKKDVRGHIKNMIDMGASLAAIQKKCVNKAVLPLSSAVVPSMNQLKNANIRLRTR
jgi:hypothetical protein